MRRPGIAAAVALAALAPVACGEAATEITDAERAAIAVEVRTAVDAFAEAERRRDAEAIVSFIAPGFYMYGDGVRSDYDAVTAQMRATIPRLQRFDTTWSDIEVNVLGRQYALTTMLFRDAITDAEGNTTRLRGPSTMLWRRIDGEWRIVFVDADHYPDTPG